MNYRRRLAVAMRARGADDRLVAEVLRETDDLQLSDDSLERELGAPEEYAEALVPERARRKKVGPVLLGGLVAAGAWLVLALADGLMGWGLREALGPMTLAPAILLMALGVLGQFVFDYAQKVKT